MGGSDAQASASGQRPFFGGVGLARIMSNPGYLRWICLAMVWSCMLLVPS